MIEIATLISAVAALISAVGSWRSNRRTHACLNSHIDETRDHHAYIPKSSS